MKTKKYSIFVGLSSLAAVTLLGGCSTILLFDPKGPIGEAERFLIIAAIVLMLALLLVRLSPAARWTSIRGRPAT